MEGGYTVQDNGGKCGYTSDPASGFEPAMPESVETKFVCSLQHDVYREMLCNLGKNLIKLV
jgi:hypothetical protein